MVAFETVRHKVNAGFIWGVERKTSRVLALEASGTTGATGHVGLTQSDSLKVAVRSLALPSTTRRQVLTIMFVDIRDSSRIEETLPPERTLEFLNSYLGLAAQAIRANNGVINQVVGDGVVATFGLLDESDHGAANALAAAVAIHGAFESASGQRGSEPVRAIVAMHTGTAIVGDISRAERTDYGVFGSAVNVVARLESEGKQLGLRTVLSGSTVSALLVPSNALRLVTRKTLRGLSNRVEIWSNDPIDAPVSTPASGAAFAPTGADRRSSAGRGPGWRPFGTVALTEVVVLAAFVAVVGLGLGGSRFDEVFTNLAQFIAAVAAAAVCAWTASRSQGTVRTGWALIAGSAAAWSVGQWSGGVHQTTLTVAPAAPVTDVAFLATLALGIAGVLCFWDSPPGATSRWRAVLDGLIVACALAFAAWALGLRQVYQWPGQSLLERAAEVAIPAGEIVLATVLIMVINRGSRQQLGSLLLLLASTALSAVASVLGAYGADASGSYQRFGDGGLLVALALVVLAPLYRPRSDPAAARGGRRHMAARSSLDGRHACGDQHLRPVPSG